MEDVTVNKTGQDFIFLDLPKEGLDDDKVVDYLTRMNFTHKVTSVLVNKLNMPVFTAHQLQKPEECEKMMDEFFYPKFEIMYSYHQLSN